MSNLPHVGSRPIRNAADVARFALAGNAVLTVVSKRTEARFTFRISAARDAEPADRRRFVHQLLGGEDRAYLGMIIDADRPVFRLTKKSTLRAHTPTVRAITFLCERVLDQPGRAMPEDLEVWHMGRCGKCNRPLTVPESIERGIGPECWARLGGD